jgi:hypothetical protein
MGPRPPRLKIVGPAKPRDERPVYVRFVCFHTVGRQRTRLGLFQAIEIARDSDQSAAWALEEINELSAWFSDHLPVPEPIKHGTRRGDQHRALSWFKPQAVDHVRRMYELKAALEACGVHVEILTTRTPGVVTYEDEHQLTAVPRGGMF